MAFPPKKKDPAAPEAAKPLFGAKLASDIADEHLSGKHKPKKKPMPAKKDEPDADDA